MRTRLQDELAAAAVSNVELVPAGFLSCEHSGDPADVVCTRWALHHLPDFWGALALARMRTALRPGGVLRLSDVVSSFDPRDAEVRSERWCSSLPTTATREGEWTRDDVEEHVRDEHSTSTRLLEAMLERAGFAIEDRALSDDQVFAQYVARAV